MSSNKLKQKRKPKKLILKKEFKIPSKDFLETEFEKLKTIDNTKKKEKENKLLLSKEFLEEKEIKENDEINPLYPTMDDANFVVKIAQKKEFNDTRFDGTIHNVKTRGDELSKLPFELATHQLFVRNFLSFQTPYNSLLLFHGLGSGKTCSAISICEEMRSYLKQTTNPKRILVVASPNVQENFRLQLFDERKLKKINNLWNIRGCTGNQFIKEINPMSMKGLGRERVINQINRIINQSYLFLGYTEFANYITRIISKFSSITDEVGRERKEKLAIQNEFSNRLIVIDEVQNIRISNDAALKRVSANLMKVVEIANNVKLLLLSATPMFNTHKEIVWLVNLMNANDGRSTVSIQDVFTETGRFKISRSGEIVGKELLIKKARGYISYVRGDNPYTFPYRIFPSLFDNTNSSKNITYPTRQATKTDIKMPIQTLDLFVSDIGEYQQKGYQYLIDQIDQKIPNDKQLEVGLGYTTLEAPIQSLNIVFPSPELDDLPEGDKLDNNRSLIGKEGLSRCMKYTEKGKKNFSYKKSIEKKYGKIFSYDKIGKYSSKIKKICEQIIKSKGIVLVYSQYIDGGCVPMALALEELGLKRSGDSSRSLFKKSPEGMEEMKGKNYAMITGDASISPDNQEEIKALTNDNNKYGEKIKVVIISKAASEGIDFKNIRQVHIMEPWYNLMRIEQIIGRAVRTYSHILLPFIERNVQIFMHGTLLEEKQEESIDLYVYRLAERKAIQIGIVSRILKEVSVDCLLNSEQNNFTEENFNQKVKLTLSSGEVIDYKIGDKPFSASCDYMKNCEYNCRNENALNRMEEIEDMPVSDDTYTEPYIVMYLDKIHQQIKEAFYHRYAYEKMDLIKEINKVRLYPLSQINYALEQFINDKNLYLTDSVGRTGHLVNIGNYYMFQPEEINFNTISHEERRTPIDYKRSSIMLETPKMINETIDFEDSEKDKKSKLPKTTTSPKLKKTKSKTQTGPETETTQKSKTKKVITIQKNIEKLNVLLKELEEKFKIMTKPVSVPRGKDPLRGKKDWYAFCGRTTQRLLDVGITIQQIEAYSIGHLIDSLVMVDKKIIYNHIYSNKKLNKFEKEIKKYLDTQIIKENKNIYTLLLTDDTTATLFKFDKDEFRKALPSEIESLQKEIVNLIVKASDANNIIGFITLFKKSFTIFKTKDVGGKRNSGSRCDQAGKQQILKTLSAIEKNPELVNDITLKKINTTQLCSEQEFRLRHYDSIKRDGKRWFFTPEIYTISKELSSSKINKN